MESSINGSLGSKTKKVRYLDKSLFGSCKICQDKATGIHYGVATCEGCKVAILCVHNEHFNLARLTSPNLVLVKKVSRSCIICLIKEIKPIYKNNYFSKKF
jgi:hypothetical protein